SRYLLCVFFFSSRRRHTRSKRDWSSDVCSSDLEAMASIGSIAQVTLKTRRPNDELGYKYEIWGGNEKTVEPAAVPSGTSVAVRNLFYNVRARRQFLKTDATEFRHILKTVQQAALANPELGFKLVADTDII